MPNPHVRVWEEVLVIYKDVAREFKLKVADLVSIVLMYAPVLSPASIIIGLEDNYDITKEEAIKIALTLSEKVKNMVQLITEKEKEVVTHTQTT